MLGLVQVWDVYWRDPVNGEPRSCNNNRNAIMADRDSVPERPINMKDSHSLSESPTELCDDCSQGTKDELEPGYIEDRFRVDRKKLEQMLQGNVGQVYCRILPEGFRVFTILF